MEKFSYFYPLQQVSGLIPCKWLVSTVTACFDFISGVRKASSGGGRRGGGGQLCAAPRTRVHLPLPWLSLHGGFSHPRSEVGLGGAGREEGEGRIINEFGVVAMGTCC